MLWLINSVSSKRWKFLYLVAIRQLVFISRNNGNGNANNNNNLYYNRYRCEYLCKYRDCNGNG